jgi:hypothetical protein
MPPIRSGQHARVVALTAGLAGLLRRDGPWRCAAWLGAPRWQGIGTAAGGAWLLVIWRRAGRLVPWLLLAALLGLAVPLFLFARGAGMGPLGAWERVASQPAFRFPASSPWVSAGRELRAGRGYGVLVFEEEHRITAASPAQLHVRARDGARVSESDWELQAGQSLTLRPGDELTWPPGARLRFEAGKAVPGAPTSGIAWADGRRWVLVITGKGAPLRRGNSWRSRAPTWRAAKPCCAKGRPGTS